MGGPAKHTGAPCGILYHDRLRRFPDLSDWLRRSLWLTGPLPLVRPAGFYTMTVSADSRISGIGCADPYGGTGKAHRCALRDFIPGPSRPIPGSQGLAAPIPVGGPAKHTGARCGMLDHERLGRVQDARYW